MGGVVVVIANWDELEQAPHLSNGVLHDLYIYVSIYVLYVIP